jgi:hypothetical protein
VAVYQAQDVTTGKKFLHCAIQVVASVKFESVPLMAKGLEVVVNEERADDTAGG